MRKSDLERLVEEIVGQVRERLLAQGLKMPASPPPASAKPNTNGAADPESLAGMIDHTLLKADATEADVKRVCDEARAHKFATVCLNSAFVAQAAQLLKGSGVKPIAVVGFPLGAASTSAKAFEAREAVRNGAQEIDMVINIGELKSTRYEVVLEDIRAVVEASKPFPVKVILETALLDRDQKAIACALSKAAGAAFVKTSTGFGPGGATAEDIALMRKIVGPEMGVKASGGIRTTEDAEKMIRAGASRIGASSSVAIVEHAADAPAQASTKGRKPFTGLPYKAGGAGAAPQKKKSDKSGGGSY